MYPHSNLIVEPLPDYKTVKGIWSLFDYYKSLFTSESYCWIMGFGVLCHFQQYFSYIVAVSFIGGGNRSTLGKPPTCRKTLTNFIT